MAKPSLLIFVLGKLFNLKITYTLHGVLALASDAKLRPRYARALKSTRISKF